MIAGQVLDGQAGQPHRDCVQHRRNHAVLLAQVSAAQLELRRPGVRRVLLLHAVLFDFGCDHEQRRAQPGLGLRVSDDRLLWA